MVRLFHIAIHSEKPIYFQIEKPGQAITRSMFACGFFEKDPKTDSGIDSGSFHYKIDNYIFPTKINSGNCKNKLKETECPFKKFEPDSEIPGSFKTVSNDIFQNLNFSKEFNSNDQQNFIRMHAFIYNAFIQYWYTKIFPLVKTSVRAKSASRRPRGSRNRSSRSRSSSSENNISSR